MGLTNANFKDITGNLVLAQMFLSHWATINHQVWGKMFVCEVSHCEQICAAQLTSYCEHRNRSKRWKSFDETLFCQFTFSVVPSELHPDPEVRLKVFFIKVSINSLLVLLSEIEQLTDILYYIK